MNPDMPQITASSYASNALNMNALFGAQEAMVRRVQPELAAAKQLAALGNIQPAKLEGRANVSTARIVKVFVADPNENLPLAARVIYSGEEKLTDLTDQELYFEVPIAELLAKHNDLRKATADKGQSEKFGRDIYLEPARIRDLRMVVVTIAQF